MRYYFCDNFVISNDPELTQEELIGVTMRLLTEQGKIGQVAFTIIDSEDGKSYACGTPFPMTLSQGMVDAMIKHLEEDGTELDDYELREITSTSDFEPLRNIMSQAQQVMERLGAFGFGREEDASDPFSLDDEEDSFNSLTLDEKDYEQVTSSMKQDSSDLTGGVVKRKPNPSAAPLGHSSSVKKKESAKRELKAPFYKKFPHYIEALQQARYLGLNTFRVFEYDSYFYLVTSDLTKNVACEYEFYRTRNYVAYLAEHGELVCSGWQDFEGVDLQEVL